MKYPRRMLLVALAPAVLLSVARANVLTVGAGGQFPNIQAAVDAASDGDTILVHPGTYAAVNVNQKSIAIVVDPPGNFATTQQITVSNLADGQRCVLSGLHVSTSSVPAVSAFDNVGSLRFEDLTCTPVTSSTPGDAMRLVHCQDVALTRCTLTGEDGYKVLCACSNYVLPGAGLRAQRSNVAVYDCTIGGGNGMGAGIGDEELPYSPTAGADGCTVDGGLVVCSGSTLHGGNGGNALGAMCNPYHFRGGDGASGGTALVVHSGRATVLDTPLIGGQGGAGGAPNLNCNRPGGANGADGPAMAGDVSTLGGAHKSLIATTLVRESMQLDVSVDGAPGDSVWLSIARDSRWAFTATRKGVTLVGPQSRSVFLGTISASGGLQASFPIGELGPGVQASTLFLQALCINPTGRSTLTGADFAVLLDSMF